KLVSNFISSIYVMMLGLVSSEAIYPLLGYLKFQVPMYFVCHHAGQGHCKARRDNLERRGCQRPQAKCKARQVNADRHPA
ncbi:hypothetical protein EV401DRAFT_1979797, partial [Pisolithus croceorrhizus]